MKHAIITSSDAKYGDFLINHWLKSLKENVDLTNIDVVVLDYGLTEEQKARLKGCIIYKGKRDGHVTNIRHRDTSRFLENNEYDQILTCDGGDIIFQEDISKIFEKDKDDFRVVQEDICFPFQDIYAKRSFSEKDTNMINYTLKDRKMINAGVIIGPYRKFKCLAKECDNLMIDKSSFGPDQVAVNFILHRDGFKPLENTYNFVITSSKERFKIKDSLFFFKNGEKIAIPHNVGNKSMFRPIINFGYGPDNNKLKISTYFLLRTFYRISNFIRK